MSVQGSGGKTCNPIHLVKKAWLSLKLTGEPQQFDFQHFHPLFCLSCSASPGPAERVQFGAVESRPVHKNLLWQKGLPNYLIK